MPQTSKATANYRAGSLSAHCGICTMFRAPSSCTAVKGKIGVQDTCDYFERDKKLSRSTRWYSSKD